MSVSEKEDVVRRSPTSVKHDERRGRPDRSSWWARTSVEPIITMSLISMSLQSVVQQNLLQDLICLTFHGGSQANCSNYVRAFNETPSVVASIQATTADYTLFSVLVGLPCTLALVVLMGQWSDRNGRKPVILVPLVGGLTSALAFVGLIRLDGRQPWYVLMAGVPAGVTGAQAMIIMGCYSYLSDTTTEAERTTRIGIADGALSVGVPIGTLLGSRIYAAWGYEAVFLAQAMAYGLTLVYAIVRIKSSVRGDGATSAGGNYDQLQGLPASTPVSGFCREFFSCSRVREGLVVWLTPRKGHLRAYIILVLSCELLNGLPQYGEFEVVYIYCRKRFDWDVETFSYYQTVTTAASALGMFILVPILAKLLLMEDAVMGVVGNLGRLAGSVLKIFSSTPLILYLSGLTEVITSVGFVVNRSILSKCVESHEQGKAFAMDGIVQALLPSFAGAVYTQVYKATLTTFMGAAFLVSVATTSVVCCIYWWIHNDRKVPSAMAAETSEDHNAIYSRCLRFR